MSQEALNCLEEKFGSAINMAMSARGDETAVIHAAQILDICRFLRDEPRLAFTMLIDLTCVDSLGLDDRLSGRFEIVYHLRSMQTGKRLRLKVLLDETADGAAPEIDSVTSIWQGANWPEREVWDMFGIRFRGHPDLRRILMYEEFVGHPLRKDYPKDKRQPLVRRDFT